MKLKELKQGEFFKLKDSPTATVYVRGKYARVLKKYSCYKFDDVNSERFLLGSKKVITDFEF